MNKRQKIVQQQFINNEEAVIKRLKQVYNQSLKDIEKNAQALQDDINRLGTLAGLAVDADEKEKLLSMKQSKVYQKQYQDALKKQVSSILDNMQVEEFKTVSEYLQKCYEDGFVGTMFDLQGQGIPLCFPLDQEAMVRAVQLDSKISQGLYSRLGEDVTVLKKKITAQVSRGISTGMSFQQVAKQLADYTNIGFNNAVRIARTEGHRIQVQSGMDACYKAKEKGADVVKQWDATLDGKTRESHSQVDGEIKELDEKFSNGLMFPGDPSGAAAEVICCRCALLQRARWALEGSFTKMNNFTKQLETFESPEAYEEFKKGFFSAENKKYMNYVQQMEEKYKTKDFAKVLDSMTDQEYKHYSKLLESNPMFNKKASKAGEATEASEEKKRMKAQEVADDLDTFDIFDFLENNDVVESEPEPEYPKKLQLTAKEQKRLDEINAYYENPNQAQKVPSEIERLVAMNQADEETFERAYKRLNAKLEEAEEMIAIRKKEGYKFDKTAALARREANKELAYEEGRIVVGESGIRHWQQQRKNALAAIEEVELAEKLWKRFKLTNRRDIKTR